MRALIVAALTAVGLAASWVSASAAQQLAPAVAISRIDTEAFPTIDAYVTVSDEQGQPLAGLGEDAFLLSEDAEAVSEFEFSAVTDRETPVLIVFGIDGSGSMAGAKLASAKAAVETISAGLEPHDRIALVRFADGAETLLTGAPADASAELDAALARIEAVGNTALYDGAFLSVQTAASSALGRRAVILLTDGRDEGGTSIRSRESALALAADTGVAIHTIALGADADAAFLRELSALSRGRALAAPSAAAIESLAASTIEEMRAQYRLRYLTGAAGDEAEHLIDVAVEIGGGQVRAEQGFTSVRVTPVVAEASLGRRSGDDLSGTVTLEPSLTSHDAIDHVEYVLDGDVVHTATDSPFRYVLNVDALDRGAHAITIRAIDASGNEGEVSYRFQVGGTSFNYGFALLVAGVAGGLSIVALLAIRARGRHVAPTRDSLGDTGRLPVVQRLSSTDGDGAALILIADGSAYSIGGGITIGRDAACDVVLEADSRSVSREHARIECGSDGCRVIDLSSVNGTRVNGRAVEESWLDDGDMIEIGSARLRFDAKPKARADATALVEQPAPVADRDNR